MFGIDECGKISSECGVKLLSRLQSKKRPSIVSLSPEIIPSFGPKPGEILEISGECGTGKTILLMDLIAQTIIPTEYGGKGASVIVIDTNSNFHVPFLLPRIIEKHVIHNRTSICPSTDTEDLKAVTDNVENIVLDAMKKMLLFKCYSATDYELTLLFCTNHLTTNSSVSMIVIDSISTFYWSEFSDEHKIRMDTYLRRRIKELQKLTDEFKIVAIYTRPTEFNTNILTTYEQLIDYKIQLKHSRTANEVREAVNFYSNQQFTRRFSINKFGIKWLSSSH